MSAGVFLWRLLIGRLSHNLREDMKVDLAEGKYILAVSGGVDSMVLLDILRKKPGVELIVAHFNHGIRDDSVKDEAFVKAATKKYGLPLETGHGKLGKNASEDLARQARYEFLESVRKRWSADAIVTAHHQDDLIETAILNIVRGTGRRGMIAMATNPDIRRPFLGTSKAGVLKYATVNNIQWREDESNSDSRYLRNYVRRHIMPQLSESSRRKILKSINGIAKKSAETEQLLATMMAELITDGDLNRAEFINLPTEIAPEVVMHWLRKEGFREFDKKTIERVIVAIKVAKPGTRHSIAKGLSLSVKTDTANLDRR